MHRFHLPPERCTENTLRLDGREAHHALHVLRLKHDERVTVLDGAGNKFLCTVETTTRSVLTLSVSKKEFVAALPCSITLLQALPKGKIFESIIQKAVELGVRRVVPILSERIVTQLDEDSSGSKREKWQQTAIEAIKQCGAAWLPSVETPMTIQQFLARQEPFDLTLVGSLHPNRRHAREVLHEFATKRQPSPCKVGVWIGPEGDFSETELAAIQNSGAQPIGLGNLVLRVETAAIYCLAILNYELQRD